MKKVTIKYVKLLLAQFSLKFKVKAQLEQDNLDKILLEEMDEDTYNQLPYEKRKEIDDRLLETKKLRLKR